MRAPLHHISDDGPEDDMPPVEYYDMALDGRLTDYHTVEYQLKQAGALETHGKETLAPYLARIEESAADLYEAVKEAGPNVARGYEQWCRNFETRTLPLHQFELGHTKI